MEAGIQGKWGDSFDWKGKYNTKGQTSFATTWKANDLLSAGISGSFNHAEGGFPEFQGLGASLKIEHK